MYFNYIASHVACDAEFIDDRDALAFVVHDDVGFFVVVRTKLLRFFSAYEAKMKAIEWAISFASSKPRNKVCFFSYAHAVVNEINSSKDPFG